MNIGTYHKHPDAVVDVKFTWADHLGEDTISSSSWTVQDGLTADSDTNDDTTTTLWLSGGTHGQTYICENTVETAGGRTEIASLSVYCTPA